MEKIFGFNNYSIVRYFTALLSVLCVGASIYCLYDFIQTLHSPDGQYLFEKPNLFFIGLYVGFMLLFLIFSVLFVFLHSWLSRRALIERMLLENSEKIEIQDIISNAFLGKKRSNYPYVNKENTLDEEIITAGSWVIERFEDNETIVSIPAEYATNKKIEMLVPEKSGNVRILRTRKSINALKRETS